MKYLCLLVRNVAQLKCLCKINRNDIIVGGLRGSHPIMSRAKHPKIAICYQMSNGLINVKS